MTTSKFHNASQLVHSYNHNYREVQPNNANPDLAHLNHEVIGLNGQTYLEAFQERIKTLPYYQNHDFRKNGVMALEIVMTFSAEDIENIDLNEWKQDNAKWLRDNFNICPDKYGDNVISMVYHGDEVGNVHCHAVVIPVDENGKINAYRYLNNRASYIELQNSYGKAMEKHGLKRGIENSKANHKDIKKFYSELNNAIYGIAPPTLEKGETMEQYQQRVAETFKKQQAAHLREKKEWEREKVEISEYKDEKHMADTIRKQKEVIKDLENKNAGLIHEFGSVNQAMELAKEKKEINDALKTYPNKQFVKQYNNMSDELLSYNNKKRIHKKEKSQTHDAL